MTEPRALQGPDPNRDPDAIADAAQDWLLRRQAGAPTAVDQAQFEAWCDADPRHRAAYAEVAAMWRDADALEHAFAPRGQQPAREHSREQAAIAVAPASRGRRWRGIAVASSLLAAVGMLLFVFAPTMSHLPERLLADHATAIGEQKRVVLPDGSVALLNTGSALDVAYSDQRRVATLLHGEAWFVVMKDAARPFDVVAAGGRATAVGTTFAVRHDDDGAMVTVTEGVVRVTSPDSGSAAADSPRLLAAGQQVSFRRGAAPGAVRTLDAAAATAWRHGGIAIRDRPLGDALAEIGRYRSGRVILLGDASRYGLVTARLSLADIDGGIDALAATHGLSVTRVTGWLLIVR